MGYVSPAALEMAVKSAASQSPLGTSNAISAFYRHRLLCRVFSSAEGEFILKGGHGVLARTINARATRDIDLLATDVDLENAAERLHRLASIDLGDFVSFTPAGTTPIKLADRYRNGLSVSFDAHLGAKKMGRVSIDLVVDDSFDGVPDTVAPADRLAVDGLEVYDYQVYPAPYAIADKVCGIMEEHDGRPSSRVKDLVDILVYAQDSYGNGAEFCAVLDREIRIRGLAKPPTFRIPDKWHVDYGATFAKVASGVVLMGARNLKEAEELARCFIDPVLDGSADGLSWLPEERCWLSLI